MWIKTCLLAVLLSGVADGRNAGGLQSTNAPPADGDLWAPLESLVGEWIGEGTGDPGQGTGGFSFSWDLGKKVLTRRNFAEYPATKDRPAFSHQDLTIIYKDAASSRLKAIYFDNEGHVINYEVSATRDAGAIQFLSDASPASPRYRLTDTTTGASSVSVKFEISPPGKPEAFSTYIQATARRK
jgi:hypothetical protein